jgi:Leucine-rich repeat (LRR) protein
LTNLVSLIIGENKNITDAALSELDLGSNENISDKSISKMPNLTILTLGKNKQITGNAIAGLIQLVKWEQKKDMFTFITELITSIN